MDIIHDLTHRKVWTEEEGQKAYVTYKFEGDCLTIDHTYVPPQLEGRGIAAALVRFVCDYALSQGFRPAATCSYANIWLQRHPEYLA